MAAFDDRYSTTSTRGYRCGWSTCICNVTTTNTQTIYFSSNTIVASFELDDRPVRRPRAPAPRVDPWVPARLAAAAPAVAWPVALRRFRGDIR